MITSLEEITELLSTIATAFTARPVLILPEQEQRLEKPTNDEPSLDQLVLYLPKIPPTNLTDANVLAYYKGLTILQASAIKYKTHVVKPDLVGRAKAAVKSRKIHHTMINGDDNNPHHIMREIDNSGFSLGIYSALELVRRKRLLAQEYEPLDEDFTRVIATTFDTVNIAPASGRLNLVGESYALASCALLWRELGVPIEVFERRITDRKKLFQNSFKKVDELTQNLGREVVPEEGFWAGLNTLFLFYEDHKAQNETKGLGMAPNPFVSISMDEVIKRSKAISDGAQYLGGLGSSMRQHNVAAMLELPNMSSLPFIPAVDVARTVFIDDTIFDQTEKSPEESKDTRYYPEKRGRALHSHFCTVKVHELGENSRIVDEDIRSQKRAIEREIAKKEEEHEEINRKYGSDINYLYDLQDLRRKMNGLQRDISGLRKDIKTLEDTEDSTKTREFHHDPSLVYRIEQEMTLIRPTARTKVRRLFEGELDSKRYADYLMQVESGADPRANYFWRWKRNKRDIATMILLDASLSGELMADDTRTILDHEKLAALHLSAAVRGLGDRCAIAFYSGKSQNDVRVYIIKDFDEEPQLQELFPKIVGRDHNRDGAAIRWATDILDETPARTKFLFHIGDLEPSDITLASAATSSTDPYKGALAFEDTIDAYNSARAYGIIPYGFCMRMKEPETTAPLQLKGKLKLPVRVAVPPRRSEPTDAKVTFTDRLRGKFQGNYSIIRDPRDLPAALQKVYVDMSFR